ncbi:hypothetical protein SASPL_152999 [Salvia splendens]|uniref:Cadmium-induced protein AS8 n=2 Tax=Salvia splendens TaxID=180675 RepID=A0A8X8W4E1_SALSN|nr:cadmium-induced protein AS8-like isoform X1 [Salvia splendens]KAG6387805.1 hypothetical protein SASPL_152999 [Salvia splendens]
MVVEVEMIIKGLFRRYERRNPVNPTIGAFWGVGIGIGCGVGWGPGFGHEVVGYVGAGCGAGFNVGITFLGVGLGLPANYLFRAPHSELSVEKKGSSLTGSRSTMEDDRTGISGTQQSQGASFSGFKVDSLKNFRDLPDVRSMFASYSKHVTDCLHRVTGRLNPSG